MPPKRKIRSSLLSDDRDSSMIIFKLARSFNTLDDFRIAVLYAGQSQTAAFSGLPVDRCFGPFEICEECLNTRPPSRITELAMQVPPANPGGRPAPVYQTAQKFVVVRPTTTLPITEPLRFAYLLLALTSEGSLAKVKVETVMGPLRLCVDCRFDGMQLSSISRISMSKVHKLTASVAINCELPWTRLSVPFGSLSQHALVTTCRAMGDRNKNVPTLRTASHPHPLVPENPRQVTDLDLGGELPLGLVSLLTSHH